MTNSEIHPEYERFFVIWPRRIENKWVWLSYAQRALKAGGGGLGGDFWYVYKLLQLKCTKP